MSSTRGHGLELLPKPERPGWQRWFASKRIGLVVAVSVLLIVVAVRFIVSGRRAASLQAIATEVGSVAEFWGEVSPNHAGTEIVFKQSTETGVGAFFSPIEAEREVKAEVQGAFSTRRRVMRMNSGEVLLDTNEGEKWKVGKQKAEIGNSTPHPRPSPRARRRRKFLRVSPLTSSPTMLAMIESAVISADQRLGTVVG